MARAINIDATEQHVTNTCGKHGAVITSIETLRSGGTRVVVTNGDSAAIIRRAYGSKVIEGAVTREPSRVLQSTYAAPPAPVAKRPYGS